jgi:hypothetical protein
MTTKKPRLTIYLTTQELLDELQSIADREQRSLSNLTSIALANWVASQKSGKNTNGSISAEDADQIKKFISLLCGEHERNSISFVFVGQALGIDPEKLHELYQLVKQCRAERKEKS